jgi:hypothetical protein
MTAAFFCAVDAVALLHIREMDLNWIIAPRQSSIAATRSPHKSVFFHRNLRKEGWSFWRGS